MMKYPKEYLDEIKLKLKVSEVVGKYVNLKKRGKEFVGLSPFKNEKTPSFTVNDEKGFYHCFSSGEHGNIFDFLMKTRALGFGEAVKTLAAEAGMPIFRFTKLDEQKDKRFKTYKEIQKVFLSHCVNSIFKSENQNIMDYLKKRNLKIETIKEFGIGFAKESAVFDMRIKNLFKREELLLSGLYYERDNKEIINRFNSRIVFPIKNLSGDVIGFGGRATNNKSLAKYINSPETEFYKKGKIVFNLDKAKNFRHETSEVIIVEGYLDVITLHQNGFKNVVSNSGTAITENQLNLIWRFFSNPTICLDGDESGVKAAERASERLFPNLSSEKKLFFSIITNGMDPDDLLRKKGVEEFKKVLKSKIDIIDFIWDTNFKEVKNNNPYELAVFENKIKKIVSLIKDETLQKYIYEIFIERLRGLAPSFSKRDFKKSTIKNNIYLLRETKDIFEKKNKFTKENLIELSILYIGLKYPEIFVKNIDEISKFKFKDENAENLKNYLMENLGLYKKKEEIKTELNKKFAELINKIENYSNVRLLTKNKKDLAMEDYLKDLLEDLKFIDYEKKIESLEAKLLRKFDESSFNELQNLKNQVNNE